jgi:hypothetical protein
MRLSLIGRLAFAAVVAGSVAAPVAVAAATDNVKPTHHLQHLYHHAQRAVENQGIQSSATAQFVPNADHIEVFPL